MRTIEIECDKIEKYAFKKLPKSVCHVLVKPTARHGQNDEISLPENTWLEYEPTDGGRAWVKRTYLNELAKK